MSTTARGLRGIAKQALLLFAAFVPLLAIKWYLAARALPIPLGDGLIFYTIEYQFAFRGDLAHPYLDPLRPSGGAPFTWHGWLSQLLIGTVAGRLPGAAAQVADVLKAEVAVMAYELAFAAACLGALAHKVPASVRTAVMVVFGVSLWTSAGRPEVVAQFLLLLGIVAIVDAPVHFRSWLIGLLLGLMAAAQPTIAVLSAILLCGYVSTVWRGWRIVRTLCTVAIIAACTLAFATALLHPYGLREWILGTARVFGVIAVRSDGSAFYYFFLQPSKPLFGLWLVLWPASFAYLVWTGRVAIAEPRAFLASIGMMVAAIWFFGFRAPATCYNVMALATPMALCAGLALAGRGGGAVRPALLAAYGGLVAMACAGVAWSIVVALSSNASGIGAAQAAQAIRSSFRPGEPLELPPAFALLVPELSTRQGVTVEYETDVLAAPATTFAVQSSSGRHFPPSLAGLRLADDCFRHGPVTLVGIRIANTPVTYEFARYEPAPAHTERMPEAPACSVRQR